jgi:tetratricopeptide (TPR) repeat protein
VSGRIRSGLAVERLLERPVQSPKTPSMSSFNPMNWFGKPPKREPVSAARNTADDYCAEGNALQDEGRSEDAAAAYRRAIEADPTWSAPWFNLGLRAKFDGQWKECLAYNQKAVELDPKNEGAWWNLGIAATALGQWREARRAWRNSQMEMQDCDEPTNGCAGFGGAQPVRLNPHKREEVVWGLRLDPARVRIANLPLPGSGFQFGDVVLIDGTGRGSRIFQGKEILVHDVLARLEPSNFRVFRVRLPAATPPILHALALAADQEGGGAEHWDSSVVNLCGGCDDTGVSTDRDAPGVAATEMFVAARDRAHMAAIEDAFARALNGRRLTAVEEFDLSPRYRPTAG